MNLSGFCARSALTIPVDAHSSPLSPTSKYVFLLENQTPIKTY